MVMQTRKVETDAEDLSRSQLDDIRQLITAGFGVKWIADRFSVDQVALQKRLDNVPRQRTLFECEVSR